MWDDLAQRFFSDDGRGNGHLIAGAINQFYSDFGASNPLDKPLGRAVAPIVAALPSRADLTAQLDRLGLALARDDSLPPWRDSERTSDAEFNRLVPMLWGPMSVAKSLMGDDHLRTVFQSRDRFETVRAAVLVACALESHRAAHAGYPAHLRSLVPGLLPSVPLDPFDGNPLRYTVTDGSAVLYSIGADLTDNSAARPREAESGPPRPDRAPPRPGEAADWILYSGTPAAR
jgi:hypothetical protein